MCKEEAKRYLGYEGRQLSPHIEMLMDEAVDEVKMSSEFKVVTKTFTLTHNPLRIEELNLTLPYDDLSTYLSGATKCMVIACTLGVGLDRRLQYVGKVDVTKAVMMDAVASAYLEECADTYEETLDLGKRTLRFAPGYGDVPLKVNIELGKVLDLAKAIGVSLADGGTFLPRKSMLGIIGLGESKETRSCGKCIRRDSCSLRKEGKRCYKNN